MDVPATLREVPFGSGRYHEACQARDRILRRPLGLRLSEADRQGESDQRHFILEEHGRLVGGVIALPDRPGVVRLRQMWIESERAGHGLGRRLLEELARSLEAERVEQLVLHARAPVLGFYRKCGFREEGPEFTEVGIPHRKMRRTLSRETRSPGDRR